MNTRIELRRGIYRDSVVLMQVSQAVAACRGVTAALVAMATPLNLEIYERLGFEVAAIAQATPNDLLVAIRAEDEDLDAASAELERQLAPSQTSESRGFGSPPAPRTLGSALRQGGSLALISVPGQHAFVEAMDAIQAGVSVMLFSDNVPVEQEILLKDEAARHDVLEATLPIPWPRSVRLESWRLRELELRRSHVCSTRTVSGSPPYLALVVAICPRSSAVARRSPP